MSGGENWKSEWTDEDGKNHPWADNAYLALQTAIESLPLGRLRNAALARISTLDCSVPAFQSCDYLPPPVGATWWRTTQRDAAAWRQALEAASVDDEVYAKALAKVLRALVCSGGEEAIYIVRGLSFGVRFASAGDAASGLFDDLMNKDSKDCPVAASLTGADRANLRRFKQNGRGLEAREAR
jgi:hypothetical protein